MTKNIEDYFKEPKKKSYYYDWTTWDTLAEVDRLMESHHGWRAINWKALPGTKEISSHSSPRRVKLT